MCGIWGSTNDKKSLSLDEKKKLVNKLLPRGPEHMNIVNLSEGIATLGFTRLAINGLTPAGNQPMISPSGRWTVVCNGEIYNYKELAIQFGISSEYLGSDCYVIPWLLEKYSVREVCRFLDGVFAFLAWDSVEEKMVVGRDSFGVRPLFMLRNADTTFWSSEIKALPTSCKGSVQEFPPSHYGEFREYNYKVERWTSLTWHPSQHIDSTEMKSLLVSHLEKAVEKRLLSDRPIGALLSGGLDSSLIASICARLLKKQHKSLHTFSIGLGTESPDILAARKVAKHIGSIHHEVIFSQEEFLDAIPQVVTAVETFDITTIRASVGNWLIGKWIRENTEIKVVMNGDGSDELFGGYLYFYRSPDNIQFQLEVEKLLENIHLYDVRRSERSMAAHGLESRTPFLDRHLVDFARRLDPALLRPVAGKQMEKEFLRSAFKEGHLPEEIVWRRKEAFSDGVSSGDKSWFQVIQEYAEDKAKELGYVNDTEYKTAEAFWYAHMFKAEFGERAMCVIPSYWMPNWSPEAKDPSARTLALYAE
jgi:asparagine synthase (glutamine-hydrolysing)